MPFAPRPPWSRVKLRVSWGDPPPFGAILRFRSGRQLHVVQVKGRSIEALVLPDGAPVGDSIVLDWRWAPRKRKPSRRPGR